MQTKPPARLRGIATERDFLDRIGFDSIAAKVAKSGKKPVKVYGADVLDWGHKSEEITDVLARIVKEGWGGHYLAHTNFMPELKQAFADFERDARGIDCEPGDIIPVSGIGPGWNLLHYALVEPGDEMLCVQPAHYFWNPATQLQLYGAKAVGADSFEEGVWRPDIEDLRRKVTRRTKAIVMVHPNNPTGTVYTQKTLKSILDVAGENDLAVISDEIYDLITYDGVESKSAAAISSDVPVITTYSTSKFFMNPGWRIGFLHIHDPKGKMNEYSTTLKRVSSMYGNSQNTIPTFLAAAAAKVFRGPFKFKKSFLGKLQRSRDATYKWLNAIDGISCAKPQGSIYAFPRVEGIGTRWASSEGFLTEFAKAEGVAFVPGSYFGAQGEGHFRTLLLPEVSVLDDVYGRLESFMKANTKRSSRSQKR